MDQILRVNQKVTTTVQRMFEYTLQIKDLCEFSSSLSVQYKLKPFLKTTILDWSNGSQSVTTQI